MIEIYNKFISTNWPVIIYLTVLILSWLVIYIKYQLDDEDNKKSNAYILIPIEMILWPIGLIMIIPIFIFLFVGDLIVKKLKNSKDLTIKLEDYNNEK